MADLKKKNDNQKKGWAPAGEKLNEYVRISGAGGKIFILALAVVVAALLIWGLNGRIPVTITEKCIIAYNLEEPQTGICLVNIDKNISNINQNDPVTVQMPDGKLFSGKVLSLNKTPYSEREIRAILKPSGKEEKVAYAQWLLDKLLEDVEYAYILYIDIEGDLSYYWGEIANATIVTDEAQPISFFLK